MNQVKKDVLFMLVRGNEKKAKVAKIKETFKELYEDGLLIELIKELNWWFLQETPQVTFEQKEREAKWIALLANQGLGEADKAFIDKKWKETEWSLKRHKSKEKFKGIVEIYANELNFGEAKMWLEELTKEEEKEDEETKGKEKLKYVNRKTDSEIVSYMKEWQKYEISSVKKIIEEMIKRNYRIHHEEIGLPKELILDVQSDVYRDGRTKMFQNVLGLEYADVYMELFKKEELELSEEAREQIQNWKRYIEKSTDEKHHYAEMLDLKELEKRTELLICLSELEEERIIVQDEKYKKIARENRMVLSNGRLIFSEEDEVFEWDVKNVSLKTFEMISLKLRHGKKVFEDSNVLKKYVELLEEKYHNDLVRTKTSKERLLGVKLYMEALGIIEPTEWNQEKERYDWLEYHRTIQDLSTVEFMDEIEKNICKKYNLDVKGKEILKFLKSDWIIAHKKYAFVAKNQPELIKEIESYFAKDESQKVFEMVNEYVMSV